jgi:hypothetical protein
MPNCRRPSVGWLQVQITRNTFVENNPMTTTTMNGNVRKSLSEQIDRLDTILDGLAEGLSGAVADAVRASVGLAVQEAVKAVLLEVLGNPAVLAKLRGTTTQAVTPEAPKHGRSARLTGHVKAWAGTGWAKVRAVCNAGRRSVVQAATAAQQYGQVLWAYRRPLLAAVATGVGSGVAAFYAGPWVAATAAGLAGFTAATAAQAVVALRQLLARYTAPSDA